MKENRRSVKDLAYGGLFTALIAAGAFLKITIPGRHRAAELFLAAGVSRHQPKKYSKRS